MNRVGQRTYDCCLFCGDFDNVEVKEDGEGLLPTHMPSREQMA
jgi:hypothetical protein